MMKLENSSYKTSFCDESEQRHMQIVTDSNFSSSDESVFNQVDVKSPLVRVDFVVSAQRAWTTHESL
jgi:hypothetical protein